MARIEHYDVGDLWTPQMTWKVDSDNDGVPDAPTDPTQIVIRLQEADGTESVLTTASSPSSLTSASTPLARLSQGVFKLNPGVTLDASGYWFIRAEGTGSAEASEEFQAIVDPSEFTADGGLSDRALVGLAETKDWLQQQNVNTAEDLELVRVINDISDRIHQAAQREFRPISAGSSTRNFVIECYTRCIDVGDMATLTTASPAVTVLSYDRSTTIKTLNNSDFVTYPETRQPWEPIRRLEVKPSSFSFFAPYQVVQVTGTWGFPQVPGNIRQAALDAIAAMMDRDVEHYRQDLGVAQQEGGNTIVLQSPQQMFVSLPPSAFAVARSYKDPILG